MSERERPTQDPDPQQNVPKPKEPFEQVDISSDHPDRLKKDRRQRGAKAEKGPNNPI
jgi:hypothetical protein